MEEGKLTEQEVRDEYRKHRKDKAFAELQTPPLPVTPMPNVAVAAANTVPNTNLTPTEQALLSPEEQIIASRT